MAQDLEVNRNVVVKVLDPEYASSNGHLINKLRQEYDLVQSMPDDPHILKYLKFFDETQLYSVNKNQRGSIYGVIVMELQPYGDLLAQVKLEKKILESPGRAFFK